MSGTDQYLNKPFELEELLTRVRNLPQPPTTAAQGKAVEQHLATYQFGSGDE